MVQDGRVPVGLVQESEHPDVVATFRQLTSSTGIGNIHRVLANSPVVFARYRELVRALRQETVLDPAERELAILCVLERHHGHYELAAHRQAALGLGLTQQQIDHAGDSARAAGLFSERQRCILRFAERFAEYPDLAQGAGELRVEDHLDDRARVELALTLALYLGLAHFTGLLDVPAESAQMLQSLRSKAR